MKKYLFFVLVLPIFLGAGCNYKVINDNPIREFTFAFDNGVRGSIQLQYKPESCYVVGKPDKASGCYYYILKYIDPKDTCSEPPRLTFGFYDKNEFALYSGFTPGWNDNPDVESKTQDGWELKGKITEVMFPQANFQEIDHIKTSYYSRCN
jgi:hypothetical protein